MCSTILGLHYPPFKYNLYQLRYNFARYGKELINFTQKSDLRVSSCKHLTRSQPPTKISDSRFNIVYNHCLNDQLLYIEKKRWNKPENNTSTNTNNNVRLSILNLPVFVAPNAVLPLLLLTDVTLLVKWAEEKRGGRNNQKLIYCQ